jgi:predicted nucleic acid-binding protein
MTAIYLESSALLNWLLGEPQAQEVIRVVNNAQTIVSSVLTIIETERALIRAECSHMLTAGQAEKLKGLLARSRAAWFLMEISEEVRSRACGIFPVEPVRTLDAIHLATALLFMRVFPDLQLYSFDERMLANARLLGIDTEKET